MKFFDNIVLGVRQLVFTVAAEEIADDILSRIADKIQFPGTMFVGLHGNDFIADFTRSGAFHLSRILVTTLQQFEKLEGKQEIKTVLFYGKIFDDRSIEAMTLSETVKVVVFANTRVTVMMLNELQSRFPGVEFKLV